MPSERDKASENPYEPPQPTQPQGDVSSGGRIQLNFGRVLGVFLILVALPAMVIVADVSFAIGRRYPIVMPIATVAAPLVAFLFFGIGVYMMKTAK